MVWRNENNRFGFLLINRTNIMKNIFKTIILAGCIIAPTLSAVAGDEARWGSAGAEQLRINSWGRNSGWGNSNVAGVRGVESFFLNPAGIAKTGRTELAAVRTNYLAGTDIFINSFAFVQRVGQDESDFIGMSLMQFDAGNIDITTVEQPDGGVGTYRPSVFNLGLAYGKAFTNSISGGFVTRIIQESITDIRMSGVSFDFGVQYATSFNPDNTIKKDDLRLGVSFRNVGPDMRPAGDGLTYKANISGASYESSVNVRAASVQLPTLYNIGGAWDINLSKEKDKVYDYRMTLAANFNFNPYAPNFTSGGVEFAYKEILMLRTGYNYHKGAGKLETSGDAHTGFAWGISVDLLPLVGLKGDDNNTSVAIDFSHRTTNPFSGTYTFGMRINWQ